MPDVRSKPACVSSARFVLLQSVPVSFIHVSCQPRNTYFCTIINSCPSVPSHFIVLWSADNSTRAACLPLVHEIQAPSPSSGRLQFLESFRGTVPLRPVRHPQQIHAVKSCPGGPDVDAYNQASICAAYACKRPRRRQKLNVTCSGLPHRTRALCGDATSLHLLRYLVLVG